CASAEHHDRLQGQAGGWALQRRYQSGLDRAAAREVDLVRLDQRALLVSTVLNRGTAELPLPIGERAGVRGNQPLDRNPLTPPLSPAGRGSRPKLWNSRVTHLSDQSQQK